MRPTQEVVNEFVKLAGRPFLERPDYFFECNICNSILEDPVCCEGGLHTFCRTCLTAYMASNTRPRCPRGECKLPQHAADLRPAPIALHMCIRNLQIKCTLSESDERCSIPALARYSLTSLCSGFQNVPGLERRLTGVHTFRMIAQTPSVARALPRSKVLHVCDGLTKCSWHLRNGSRRASVPTQVSCKYVPYVDGIVTQISADLAYELAVVSSSSSSSQAHPESDIPGTTAAQGTVAVRGSNANPVDYEALRQSISAEVQQAIDRQFLLYSCGNPQREEHSQATRQDAEAPRNEEDIPPLRTLPSPVPSLLDGLPPPAYRSRLGSVVSIDTILREAPPSYRPRSRQARVTLELPHFPDLSPLPFTFTRRR